MPRIIHDGEYFYADEVEGGLVELEQPPPVDDPPPEATRGEPWGWRKGAPYPRGWRADGRYDSDRNLLAEAWLERRLGPRWSATASAADWATAWATVDEGWQP